MYFADADANATAPDDADDADSDVDDEENDIDDDSNQIMCFEGVMQYDNEQKINVFCDYHQFNALSSKIYEAKCFCRKYACIVHTMKWVW